QGTLQPNLDTLERGAEQLKQESGRSQSAQEVLQLGSGAIASAPAMFMVALGVPAPIAFGIDANLAASGRGADFWQIAKETGIGALLGGAFEARLPAQDLLNAFQQRLIRAGIVGGTTAALTGDPKESLINLAFAATQGGKRETPVEVPKG